MISLQVYARNDGLEIRLVNNNEITLSPGTSFCVSVMLKNYSNADEEFHLRIKTPKGWSQIMDYSSEIVDASSQKLKIFSFYAPENAFVGTYSITIEAYAGHNNALIGSVQVPLYIKPNYAVYTELVKSPTYVFSGDTTSVNFLLQNRSNVIVTIRTTILNNRTSETRNITLQPDSSEVIHILVNAPPKLEHVTSATVSIKAAILGASKVNSSSTCIYKIIPSDKVKFDAYNRIPIRASGLFATNNPNGTRSYGYMYDVSGGGVIKPGKKKSLYFHFRGPNRQGQPVLGQTDIYNMRYSTPKTKIVLGDHTFGLTQLTEASRLGRGVVLEHNFKKINLGAFVNFPRYYPALKRVTSFYSTYTSGKAFNVKAGYLNKTFVSDSSSQLYTVSGSLSPVKWGTVRFEYATGKSSEKMAKAYSVHLNINRKSFLLFVDYSKADPKFPGYISNSEYISSGLRVNLFRKLSLNFNYFFNHANIALDTLYANAPYSNSISVSANYRISMSNSFSISVYKTTMEDMSNPKQFYYTDRSIQFSLMSRIRRIDLTVYSTLGKTTNLLPVQNNELATKTVLNSNVSVRYRFSNSMSLSAFAKYLGGQQVINESFQKYFYGATFNGTWRNKLKVSFQYQNNYEVQQYYKNRSLLGLSTDYVLNKKNELGIFVNYGLKKEKLHSTQLSASVRFTHTFNFPVSKRKDVGSLHGRIVNDGVQNVKGILLTLSGNILYTDQKGEFSFHNVKTGTHYLFIDNSAAGIDAIAVHPGPYKIDILPGKTTEFEMAMTTAGEIKGKVEVKKDEDLTNQGYITVKKQLKRLIIEARNKDEVFRVYTKKDGAFSFTNLRPGTWKVKVYTAGIPDGYELDTSEFTVALKSGETKSLDVIVKKIYHKIQFQKPNW